MQITVTFENGLFDRSEFERASQIAQQITRAADQAVANALQNERAVAQRAMLRLKEADALLETMSGIKTLFEGREIANKVSAHINVAAALLSGARIEIEREV